LARTELYAACDENEMPIPAWRAVHLAQCSWDGLDACEECVPDILTDLIDAERDAFHARWQRERNAALRALDERAAHDLGAIDAQERATTRRHEESIARLRHRRRLADPLGGERITLGIDIELEEAAIDAAVQHAAARRRIVRKNVARSEAELWNTDDVLIEVEPMWCVKWHGVLRTRRQAPPRCNPRSRPVPPGRAVAAPGRVMASIIVPPPKPDSVPPAARAVLHAATGPVTTAPVAAAAPGTAPVPPPAKPVNPDPRSGHRKRRALLCRSLAEKKLEGVKFRPGSPKFRQNHAEQQALRQQVERLNRLLGDAEMPLPEELVRTPVLSPAPQSPSAPTPVPLTLDGLEQERAILAAALSAHERRGAAAEDGKRRFLLYAARRQEMLSRLSRLDAHLAAARARLRTAS